MALQCLSHLAESAGDNILSMDFSADNFMLLFPLLPLLSSLSAMFCYSLKFCFSLMLNISWVRFKTTSLAGVAVVLFSEVIALMWMGSQHFSTPILCVPLPLLTPASAVFPSFLLACRSLLFPDSFLIRTTNRLKSQCSSSANTF